MADEPVSAVIARRQARTGLATALVACAALAVLGGFLTTPGVEDEDLGLAFVFTAVLIMWLLPFMARGDHSEVHGPGERHLTARTISGWRTVDLHRLALVGRAQYLGLDMLVVEDFDGVRLMLDEADVDLATEQALTEHPHNGYRVSRNAAYRLGMFEPQASLKVWWFACRLLVPLGFIVLSSGAPILLAWGIHEIFAS